MGRRATGLVLAAGLLIGTGIRLLLPYRGRPTALLFAALAFAGMVFVRLPLPIVLLGLLAPIPVVMPVPIPAGLDPMTFPKL